LNITYAEQQTGGFSIDVGDEDVSIAWIESSGVESFKVVVQKNGGISEIIIALMTYSGTAGWFIWTEDWAQTTGSNATSDPTIQDMGDYVVLTCFGRYAVHPLAMITNITISKTGIIFISTTLKSEETTAVETIAWGLWGFAENTWRGSKAYASVEGHPTQEVTLPTEHTQGTYALFSTNDVLWMDFSKPLEGITVISLAPPFYERGEIVDERDYDPTFSCRFILAGVGAMPKGEMRTAKVALYMHGPGGYEGALEMINLLVDLGKADSGAREGLESYKDSGTKDLASQALTKAKSAYDKILMGEMSGAQNDLNQALSLLRQAEEAVRTAALIRDLTYAAVPIIAVVALLIVLKMRRGR
jgi:hypothetical protein